ncbi:Carotenoid oxygenase [Penicillium verhagenii]|uniref:Carotenoid oxygenase n=1 Tax=Penicillium verhagenii TaxID=1562060 RepID=UPI0025454C3B|nr:Carotenoid oxygenase [Penicillium verhagenii]KAJ5928864.1 Carotenoid oxygenase [Penicillium verhagenii]
MPSSITDTIPAHANGSKPTEDHWNNWPNEKGFDPEYEERTPIELSVTGHIPAYTAGTLYRTGPGKSQVETEDGQLFKLAHWFDGFSQTHRFQIIASDDVDASSTPIRVLYNSRFSTDALIEKVRKEGYMVGFGDKRDPCKEVFNKMQTEYVLPSHPSERNIGVTLSVNMPGLDLQSDNESAERWSDSKGVRTLYAKTDSHAYKKLDPETLEPIGLATQTDLHPELVGPMSASHPRSDPVTGDVFNYNLTLGPISIYRIFHVSAATGKTSILATFPGTPAYIHSLSITEDYVLLCVWNSHINIQHIKTGSFKDTIMPTDPSQPATWYVVDRKHERGLMATYESPAFFCFHTINAFQEQSKEDPTKIDIVADLVRIDTSNFLDLVLYKNMKSSLATAKDFAKNRSDEMRTSFAQFRLPALPSDPSSEILKASLEWSSGKAFSPELPTMNPSFVTKKHRYSYAVTFRGESTMTDGIVKFDSETQEVSLWAHHGHSPGEPIFVANPTGVDEDDGVLLSVVLDGFQEHSYLLCLDARNLTELGRANMKGAVGFGFHGQHVSTVGTATGDY